MAGRQFKGRIVAGRRRAGGIAIGGTAAGEGSKRECRERGRARECERGRESEKERDGDSEGERRRESIDSGSPGFGFQSIPLGPRLTRLAVLPKPSVL